jgi:group I intron endonuclease
MIGIYGLRNKITEKWNIGQSWDIQTRWNRAYRLLHCKSQRKLFSALKKYGYENFEKVIIELCDEKVTQEMLDLKEVAWIKHYNSVENGYNLAYGGQAGKRSKETIEKMRIASTGKHPNKETLLKMSAWQKGRKLREADKKNLSLGIAAVRAKWKRRRLESCRQVH